MMASRVERRTADSSPAERFLYDPAFSLTEAIRTHSRLRVLHLIESFGRGGAEVLLADALPSLNLQCEVRIRALTAPDNLLNDFRQAGVDAAVLDSSTTTAAIGPLAHQLRQQLRASPVDIVHTHLFNATLVGRIARLRMPGGPRLVTTLHNPDYSNLETPSRLHGVMRGVVDWASAIAANDAIVAVSEAVAADYRRHLGSLGPWGRIEVIHNAIDSVRYERAFDAVDRARARCAWGWTPTQAAVLSIGRLTSQKNYESLIEAVNLVGSRGIDARAVVIGEGPNRSWLERQAGDRVRFHGLASREEVISAMAACDIYAQPSRFEAFGMAVLEAMVARRPVVATAVDGIREVVDDGASGILVPRENTALLADALADLAADPDRRQRLGEEGRRRARRQFGLETWVARTMQLYSRLCREDH